MFGNGIEMAQLLKFYPRCCNPGVRAVFISVPTTVTRTNKIAASKVRSVSALPTFKQFIASVSINEMHQRAVLRRRGDYATA